MQKNAASVQSMTRDLEKLSVPTEAAGFLTKENQFEKWTKLRETRDWTELEK